MRSSASSGQRVAHAAQRQVAVLVGQRELLGGQEHHGVLAERLQRLVHRDEGAEGVAVGVLVRGEQELLALAQLVQDLLAGRGEVDRHVGGRSSLQQLADPLAALGAVVVAEVQLRRALQAQLGGHPPLQVAVRGLEALSESSRARSSPSTLTYTCA